MTQEHNATPTVNTQPNRYQEFLAEQSNTQNNAEPTVNARRNRFNDEQMLKMEATKCEAFLYIMVHVVAFACLIGFIRWNDPDLVCMCKRDDGLVQQTSVRFDEHTTRIWNDDGVLKAESAITDTSTTMKNIQLEVASALKCHDGVDYIKGTWTCRKAQPKPPARHCSWWNLLIVSIEWCDP